MEEVTSVDLVQVVKQYFKGYDLNFEMEIIHYGGMQQTKSKLMVNPNLNVRENSGGFGRVTEIRMHGYWKGGMSASGIVPSLWARVDIWCGEHLTATFTVVDKGAMLTAQLPSYLPLKEIAVPQEDIASPVTAPRKEMALPQGDSAPPADEKEWARLLKRLADLLDDGSI